MPTIDTTHEYFTQENAPGVYFEGNSGEPRTLKEGDAIILCPSDAMRKNESRTVMYFTGGETHAAVLPLSLIKDRDGFKPMVKDMMAVSHIQKGALLASSRNPLIISAKPVDGLIDGASAYHLHISVGDARPMATGVITTDLIGANQYPAELALTMYEKVRKANRADRAQAALGHDHHVIVNYDGFYELYQIDPEGLRFSLGGSNNPFALSIKPTNDLMMPKAKESVIAALIDVDSERSVSECLTIPTEGGAGSIEKLIAIDPFDSSIIGKCASFVHSPTWQIATAIEHFVEAAKKPDLSEALDVYGRASKEERHYNAQLIATILSPLRDEGLIGSFDVMSSMPYGGLGVRVKSNDGDIPKHIVVEYDRGTDLFNIHSVYRQPDGMTLRVQVDERVDLYSLMYEVEVLLSGGYRDEHDDSYTP